MCKVSVAFKIFVLFLTIFLSFTLSACKVSKNLKTENSQTSKGVYYHINAEYELIETGEPVKFDYVLSCQGFSFPSNLFYATSAGAAIAIAHPEEYCQRGINGQNIEWASDRIKMPVLTWYDDVNDLTLGYVYLTNDAYASPHAKVRFKSYNVTPTDRSAFNAWKEKARAEYEQIGAIPGPFGCATSNLTVENPHYCRHPINIARNGGKGLMVADDGVSISHMVAYPMNKMHFEAAKAYLDEELTPEGIYCRNYFYYESGERKQGKLFKAVSENIVPADVLQFSKDNARLVSRKMASGELTYLSPECLLEPSLNCDIVAVYPRISSKIMDGTIVSTMIYQNQYRGFAIRRKGNYDKASPLGIKSAIGVDYPEHINPGISLSQHQFDRQNEGVLFINDKYACVTEFGGVTGAYDFDRQEILYTPSH